MPLYDARDWKLQHVIEEDGRQLLGGARPRRRRRRK